VRDAGVVVEIRKYLIGLILRHAQRRGHRKELLALQVAGLVGTYEEAQAREQGLRISLQLRIAHVG
jgi:hypothetical protein